MEKSFVDPQKAGFSGAVSFSKNGQTVLFVSGAVGRDKEGGIPDDIGEQAAIALTSLANTLSKCGASLENVVKINTYVVNIDGPKVAKIGQSVHKAFKHLPKDRRAASTWVGVTGLVEDAMKVEIECTAVVGDAGLEKYFVEPTAMGFSNAVKLAHAAGLTTLHVSGAVGQDDKGNIPDDVGEQTTIALEHLAGTLSNCGGTLADIVKRNVYIVDIDQEKLRKVGTSEHKAFKHLPKDQRSASTHVGVQGLVFDGLGVEIDCTAILPSPAVEKRFVNPQKGGFSSAVAVIQKGGLTTLFVSGAVGADKEGRIPDDVGEQAAIALDNMTSTLATCGATLADVVKINTYVVDIDQARVGKVGLSVHKAFKHLPKERRAASTWVGVTGLVDKKMGVEIECTAVIADAQSKL